MTPLAPARQTRSVKGGHDAVPPPNRKPFSFPAQKELQAKRAAGQSAAARMPDPAPKSSPRPWLLALGFALLFVAAVPWYWPAHDQETLLGLPRWVVVSIVASVLISCLTAWVFLCHWPGGDGDEPEEDA